jgi:antitoxin component YwqK of YwqJK toxin-antitoxin module
MRLIALLVLIGLPLASHAVTRCEIGGESVNPANGSTTAGKTGLMRCRDGDTGVLQREQEIRNGDFMGVVRYFNRQGVLEREYHVNEKGNRDGLSREFAASSESPSRVLREETYRNGSTVGLVRTWHPNGTLRRASFNGDDGREQAEAEFTTEGKLTSLRCAPQAVLAPAVNDAAFCGHTSSPATVELFSARGQLSGRLTHEKGERRRNESYWDSGKPRVVIESRRDGGSERGFGEDGQPRREVQWISTEVPGETRSRRTTVLEREFKESGTLVRERRWTPTERGAQLASEKTWYLNGQPRDSQEYRYEAGKTTLIETSFFDNGKPASEGSWRLEGRYDRTALGVHKGFDEQGRLRSERHHDDRGRVQRERQLDEAGKVVRDDEVFADGSRKAFAR